MRDQPSPTSTSPHIPMYTPTIGFADQYYTLWHVSEPYKVHYSDHVETKQDFTYVQNLSFDLHEAKTKMSEKYPDQDWDVNLLLKGKRSSFSKVLSLEYAQDFFLFGKYKGKSFDEIHDLAYKMWYWSAVKDTPKNSQKLHDELMHLGMILPWKDGWVTLDGFENNVEDALQALDEKMCPDDHYHAEGEKVSLDVEFLDSWGVQTQYGYMLKYIFIDREGGKRYRYEGSMSMDFYPGDQVKITGKIKHVSYYSHKDGKQIKYTKLTRPKIN